VEPSRSRRLNWFRIACYRIGRKICIVLSAMVSFSELAELTKGLREPDELPSESAQLQALEARMTSQEAV
jgi:hypothetical protein